MSQTDDLMAQLTSAHLRKQAAKQERHDARHAIRLDRTHARLLCDRLQAAARLLARREPHLATSWPSMRRNEMALYELARVLDTAAAIERDGGVVMTREAAETRRALIGECAALLTSILSRTKTPFVREQIAAARRGLEDALAQLLPPPANTIKAKAGTKPRLKKSGAR